jgi:hypothetical protein
VVCDNLKAGVTAACRYEPGINRSYADMATHYGTAIVPTRVRKPRDKAKVEVAVQLVQRWVLARLRHRRFFSLAELNGAIGELIEVLNTRPMRHLGTSRRALFDATERSALLQLPTEPYVYAEWRRCRAGIDYHVEVYGHWYSVPSRLMREAIEARITEQSVELFHRGKVVEQGADYVLALKGNQGSLHEDVRRFLADPHRRACATHRTIDGEHGRIETRTSMVCTDIGWLQDQHTWPGLAAIGQVVRIPRGRHQSHDRDSLLPAQHRPQRRALRCGRPRSLGGRKRSALGSRRNHERGSGQESQGSWSRKYRPPPPSRP